MTHSRSAEKRVRQNRKLNLRNRVVKSELKTYAKGVLAAVEAKKPAEAAEQLRLTQQKLDKAWRKGVLHKNTIARRKSRLAKRVAALKKST